MPGAVHTGNLLSPPPFLFLMIVLFTYIPGCVMSVIIHYLALLTRMVYLGKHVNSHVSWTPNSHAHGLSPHRHCGHMSSHVSWTPNSHAHGLPPHRHCGHKSTHMFHGHPTNKIIKNLSRILKKLPINLSTCQVLY